QQLDALRNAGTNFDSVYAQQQVQAHQEALNLLQTQAQTGTAEPLKAFASQTAPIVEGHLEHAQELAQNAGGAAGADAGAAAGQPGGGPYGSYIGGMSERAPPAVQPRLFTPHGGGPCFFMPDPHGIWTRMGEYLRGLAATLPARPRAILVVSGHWEERAFAFTGTAGHPGLIFDYYGFPPETYRLTWPAPGAPWLADRGTELLRTAGLPTAIDADRGFDHGVFVPLKVAFP